MKKWMALLLAVILLMGMAGCGPAGSSDMASSAAMGPLMESSHPAAGASSLGEASQNGEGPQGIEVPSFLSPEHQALYLDAFDAYYQFNVTTGFGASFSGPTHEEQGNLYYQLDGQFKKWDDFYKEMTRLFTEDFFEKLNSTPTYISVEGDLYGLMGDRGTDISWMGDRFELTRETDDRIEFEVVGTYENMQDPSSGKTEERRYPLVLERQEGQWRFSLFNISR